MIFRFNIKSGVMENFPRTVFRDALKGLKDGKYKMSIEPDRMTRSQRQNAYLWGVVYHLIETDGPGYTAEEVHQIFKDMFLKYDRFGRVFTRSTKSLNTKDFEDYAEKVRRFAAVELSINIPLPNEGRYVSA